MKKFLVCLTGGIASGKTRVSDQLEKLGCGVIDTDIMARQVVRPGSTGLQQLVAHFGHQILQIDGTLDRDALRHLVFAEDRHRLIVNQILHPLIWAAGHEAASQSDRELEVWVIPLYHAGIEAIKFARVLVVDVDESVQIQRVMKRDGVDRSLAHKILQSQPTRTDRLQLATDVLVNNGSLEQLDEQVKRVHDMFLTMAKLGVD